MMPARSEADVPFSLAGLLSRLVGYGLPVVYFLITVSFYLKTYDSAQVKITLTQIGCSLVVLFWAAQLVLEKRWPFRRDDLPLAAPFLAFLASGILSFLQSSFRAGSMDEFLRRVLYSLMGLIVIAEFRGWDRHRRLLRWLLAAFGVVVFYGFVQYLDTRLFPPGPGIGLDPFIWRQAFGQRPFSSFGNPNFFGNFLVIITPIILSIYLRGGGNMLRPYLLIAALVGVVYGADKVMLGSFGGVDASARLPVTLGVLAGAAACAGLVWWRSPGGGASGMLLFFGAMFVTLYSTETKGAWIGFLGALAAATVLAGLFLSGDLGRRTTRRLLVAAAVTVVLGLAVVGHYARQRFQSVSFRVFTWISTWEMIREQPLLGTGIGTFKWAYPAYRRPEIILIESKSNTETDHAEEEYLEVWFDEGALGFGIFLWLILSVSWWGVKALGELTRRPPGTGPPPERVYSLMAYLGAWWGALVHWLMDVSVRFVSSGVYSLLLPGLVTSLVRNGRLSVRQDPPARWDRWVRAGTAVFWTAVFCSFLRYYDSTPAFVTALPAAGLGICLFLLGEVLEWRLTPEYVPAPSETSVPAGFRVSPVQGVVLAGLLAAWGWGFAVFRNFFVADLHHNMAIFFSKSGVWSRGPEFDAAAESFPPDMREEYRRVGGALQHYERVAKLNPFFPMARYFIGNVYNDWGSTLYGQASQLRAQGDESGAGPLKEKAWAHWRKALETYDDLKEFAPNYVQTHHQVGLVYLKMGDAESAWGEKAKAEEHRDAALKHFSLYHQLDPVFPPNYYRVAYIHYQRGDLDKAERSYLGALDYNTKNAVQRLYPDRNAETYLSLGRLMYYRLSQAHPGLADVWPRDDVWNRGVSYFQSALAETEKRADSPEVRRSALDAAKGLAVLHGKAGLGEQAVRYWGQVASIDPQDPDLRAVSGR